MEPTCFVFFHILHINLVIITDLLLRGLCLIYQFSLVQHTAAADLFLRADSAGLKLLLFRVDL